MSDPPKVHPLTLFGRFITRAFLDDTGSPSIALVLTTVYTIWMMWFFTTRTGLGPLYRPLDPGLIQAVFTFGAFLILWSAALKLGAGVFVPVAVALAAALGKVVSIGTKATQAVLAQQRDYEPPDRTESLANTELSRNAAKAPPEKPTPVVIMQPEVKPGEEPPPPQPVTVVPKGSAPAFDDERDE